MKTLTIHIEDITPPIPIRCFDYIAYLHDSEEDALTGHGETKEEAVMALISVIDLEDLPDE